MRIYVCVKHVPDTAVNINITSDNGYEEVKCVPNPYDEYGMEEAVALVESQGDGEIIAVCVGNDSADNSLRSVMAMGADRSILIKTDKQFIDPEAIAKAIAKVIEQEGPADLVFTGKQSVDSEGMQTNYYLAEALGMPVVNGIVDFSVDGDSAVVKRELDGGTKETLSVKTPCVLGATKGLNEPRYPKIQAIMKARKKEIKEIDFSALEISDSGNYSLIHLEPVEERSAAKILDGSTDEAVSALVKILREEEKVI